MAKRKITAGIQSVTLPISVADTSSLTGAGLSGLVYNTASLVAEYRRQGQASWTVITLSAATLGTWSSGGFIADGALAGDYELGVPNACFAAGARWVIIRLRGATNMLPVRIEIEIDAVDYQDAVRAGLTALPDAAANAAGGLPVSAAGGLNLDSVLSGNVPQSGDSFPFADRTVGRGTVGTATTPNTTTFTPSALSPAGVVSDQFRGRIIIFDKATTTAALRGQATDITASSAAALPLLTFTALTTAPSSGDSFSLV